MTRTRVELPTTNYQLPTMSPNGLSRASAAKSARREIEEEFEEIWPLFPRKRDKGHALKAFIAARKDTALDVIVAGVEQFARENADKDPQYVAYPASWLRGQRWLDQRETNGAGKSHVPVESSPSRAYTIDEIIGQQRPTARRDIH
jgi:hypothetical protein